jgi:HAD superfamily hydrolase (TIGR01509 family)
MNHAAIIFDFDGVIVDSEVASNAAFTRVLTAAGMPTSMDDVYEFYLGRNWPDTLAALTSRWGALVPDDIQDRIAADYRAATAGQTRAVAGVLDFLASVAHLPVAVASSSASDHIHAGLGALGLADRFGQHVYSGREHVTRGKPFPDLYLHAAQALGIEPARAIVIEDSPIGARAALAAGARVFGLAAAGHCRPSLTAQLEAEGVERVFAGYGEIAEILGLPFGPDHSPSAVDPRPGSTSPRT